MLQRRIIYLTFLAGSIVFYWAHRAWLSGILLMAVVLTPWLSLALSLPAMLSCRLALRCPAHVTLGAAAQVCMERSCRFPAPMITGRFRLRPVWGKKALRLPRSGQLPTAHCGAFRISCRHLWVCDYLGLLRLPVRLKENRLILVRPIPALPTELPDMSRYLCSNARPKPGGGYSENHELRLYRPGDSLRQIHWKLSAKTGQLILREAMEVRQDSAILTMELSGAPDILDRKLGKLLGMSTYLADTGVRHRILCYTGKGTISYPVSNETEAMAALEQLLQCPQAPEGEAPLYPKALWRYHIGGDGSEN